MNEQRFTVGIDLGTTHCVMAAVDLEREVDTEPVPELVEIAQLTGPGAVEARTLLPSFLYLPHPDELAAGDLTLPWGASEGFAVGELARSLGTKTPLRLVSSAKSWLCHPGVDRRGAILPVEAPAEVARVSPFAASVRYLEHLRSAWDAGHAEAPLAAQSVILTVPASFDPAARELTAEAARAAGLADFTLLEEPQAALYAWIEATAGGWRKQVKLGDVILVVDVGGGTADFSLIAVTERDGELALTRVAVGDHILLGGDNMDLALAHVLRAKLAAAGTQLEPWQVNGLVHGCRAAKEQILADAGVQAVPVVVPSRGSRLIGGTLRTELTREEVERTLVEGFFPVVGADARPAVRARAGLTKLGLPYAQDAGVTRHLAAFLARQLDAAAACGVTLPAQASFLHPTAVLFNGGVFKAGALATRVLTTLNAWLEAEGAPPVRALPGIHLDHAVARGAAYYGGVRRGRGVRIRGGTARAYYVGVESAMPAVPGLEPPLEALCLAPFGMEEGTEAALPPQEVGLVVGEPVRFRFFGSSTRREDAVGTVLEFWRDEELEELPAIEATLPAEGRTAGDVVPVHLHARVTEIGTLALEAVSRDGAERWKVELDVRGEDAA
ncbi:molecular chaperone DnaK (HSP70) [Plasticicumulans lactativorans]|uniref:Molecular chaperone DnaK (HSP70) n=1 Tax=Plasticicumulans lactativorans TaxID=1133106 RepID=A0A4R2L8V0_9GAMM|nr:Hsp70 family protein [Plasticicumulans lactativorans]TCO83120.1 molecular chaperone DnaK (HSP70) [Plasticicumulans lactativorans]